MICAAASLNETPRSRVIREWRYEREAGLRSSAFTGLGPFLRAFADNADDVGGHVARLFSSYSPCSLSVSPSTTIADLPRSVYATRGQARCSTAITGCEVLARTSASMPSSPSPPRPKLPERIVDAGRPVHARDDFSAWSASLRRLSPSR